jgi:hypothetical protein
METSLGVFLFEGHFLFCQGLGSVYEFLRGCTLSLEFLGRVIGSLRFTKGSGNPI